MIDDSVDLLGHAVPVALPHRFDIPDWVQRWHRARAAGDYRLFPEQASGIRGLHLDNGLPEGDTAKFIDYPSGYEKEYEIVVNVPVTDREHWVQPDEYLA